MLNLMILACLLPSNSLQLPQQPAPVVVTLPKYPVAALQAAVDLSTYQQRTSAVRELVKRSIPLNQWVAASKALRLRKSKSERFDDQTVRYKVPIEVAGYLQDVEILVRTQPESPIGPQPALLCWHAADGDGASSLRMWATLADRYGLILVAPTISSEAYREDGWTSHRQGYELVQGALRFVRRHYNVDEDRIMLAGTRAGGDLVWDVGIRVSDQFAALLPANGSPRLGNPYGESNMAYLESITAVSVLSMRWGRADAEITTVDRSIEVLRQFGAQHVDHFGFASQLNALNPNLPGWDRLFSSRRTAPDVLVKFPDCAGEPHRRDFGRHHWLEVLDYQRKAKVPFPPKVPDRRWRKLDDAGRLTYLDQYLRDALPRLEVRRSGPGQFTVKDREIASFRLLLSKKMLGEQAKVAVRWRGRTIRRPVVFSPEVFLREFVERFDRTFLPVAEVILK